MYFLDNPLKACGTLAPEMFDYCILQVDGAVTVLQHIGPALMSSQV